MARSHLAKGKPSISPAESALTPSSQPLIRPARLVPVSRSSLALGPPGIHPLGQTLIVTAGPGRVQRWGGPIEDIRPGDVIWFPLRITSALIIQRNVY